jgi:hypothetical protein
MIMCNYRLQKCVGIVAKYMCRGWHIAQDYVPFIYMVVNGNGRVEHHCILVDCPCVATAYNNNHVNYLSKKSQYFILIVSAFHIIFFDLAN